jgi:uncharacterized protein YabE (DUF348 family)/3D (Asp-Asp-Asp) domain-containing protein
LQIFRHFGFHMRRRPGRRKWTTVSRARQIEKARREKFTRLGVSIALMCGITAASVASVAASTWHASIQVDGSTQPEIVIESTDSDSILRKASVPVSTDDLVSSTIEDGKVFITVRKAKHVTVAADEKTTPVTLHYGDTVAEALSQAGVTVGSNDILSAPKTMPVTDGMEITVTRRVTVKITADGTTKDYLVVKGTVADALSEAGITLGSEDITDKALTDQVTDGMQIRIGRVSYKDVTSTQEIPYQTVTKKDSSMSAGTKVVKTKGQKGVKTIVIRQKLCDGKVVESTVTSSTVTKQPVNEVVVVGTRSLGKAYASVGTDGTLIDHNGKRISYRKVYTGRCTAYSGGWGTASGMKPAYGRVAVNPKIIPYGTRLYICSPNGKYVYGYAVAADTGTAAMSGSIVADLYFNTYAKCCRFGARTMNVYVLD